MSADERNAPHEFSTAGAEGFNCIHCGISGADPYKLYDTCASWLQFQRDADKVWRGTLSGKGQLVIPADVRKLLGMREGMLVSMQVTAQGQIVLTPVTRQYVQSLRGSIRRKSDNHESLSDVLSERRRGYSESADE